MKVFNDKMPLPDRRVLSEKGQEAFERQSFADLKSTLGDLFDLVTVVKDRIHGLDQRLERRLILILIPSVFFRRNIMKA